MLNLENIDSEHAMISNNYLNSVVENKFHTSLSDISKENYSISKYSKKDLNNSFRLQKGVYYDMHETLFTIGKWTKIVLSNSLIECKFITECINMHFPLLNQVENSFSIIKEKKRNNLHTDIFELSIIQHKEKIEEENRKINIDKNNLSLEGICKFDILGSCRQSLKNQLNIDNKELENHVKTQKLDKYHNCYSTHNSQEATQASSCKKTMNNNQSSSQEDIKSSQNKKIHTRSSDLLNESDKFEKKIISIEENTSKNGTLNELLGKKRNTNQNGGDSDKKRIFLSESITNDNEKFKKIKNKLKKLNSIDISENLEDFDILIANKIENSESFITAISQVVILFI